MSRIVRRENFLKGELALSNRYFHILFLRFNLVNAPEIVQFKNKITDRDRQAKNLLACTLRSALTTEDQGQHS